MSLFNTRHGRGERLQPLLDRRLERVTFAPNHKALKRHLDLRLLNGKKGSTVGCDAELLARWASHLGKRTFLKAREEDFISYFRQMQAEEYAPTTMYHHFVVLRTFYRETTGLDKPPQLGRFKVKRAVAERLTIKDVIEPDEMVAILGLFETNVEVAALQLMYECGLRAGELLYGLKVKSLEAKGDEMWLHVLVGKTGPRSIIAFPPVDQALRELMAHRGGAPRDPEAPLLMHRDHKGQWKGVDEGWLSHIMKRINGSAVVHKPVWPHLLRHSCATNMARRGEQEADMRAYLGWTYDSDMPSYYTHLAKSDHERGWRRSRGISSPEKPMQVGLQMRACGNCGHKNSPTADYCSACNRPLTVEAARRAKEAAEKETLGLVLRGMDQWLKAQKVDAGSPATSLAAALAALRAQASTQPEQQKTDS